MEVEKWLIGGLVAVLGYFLRNTMQQLKDLSIEVGNNRNEINLLKQEALNSKAYFNEKFDMVIHELREMRIEFRNTNH